jgi:lysozyme family protein
MSDFQPCLAFTLEVEGGYQCNPQDAGNYLSGIRGAGTLIGTCRGISAPTLAGFLGPEGSPLLTEAYMRALPEAVAAAIYGAQYWLPCAGPALAAGVDLMVFDHAVNCGVRRSVRLLQSVLGVTIDGFAGPRTLAAAAAMPPAALIDRLGVVQAAAYRNMPGVADFLDGWLARLQQRRTAAHNLLQKVTS